METKETAEKIEKLICVMADESERLIALHPEIDSQEIIRYVVEDCGFSFNAYFCVACEIGERKQARRKATA